MKNSNPLFKCSILLLILVIIFSAISCNIGKGKTSENQNQLSQGEDSKKVTKGVISLLDSLGVGDVPGYPDEKYDKELNDQLGEFKNQLIEIPDEFVNVLYMVYVTKDTTEEVISFYNSELKKLGWETTYRYYMLSRTTGC